MGNPVAKGVRALSEGDRNVIHFALSGPSQFILRLLNLIMQAAQDILALLGILCCSKCRSRPVSGRIPWLWSFRRKHPGCRWDLRLHEQHIWTRSGNACITISFSWGIPTYIWRYPFLASGKAAGRFL